MSSDSANPRVPMTKGDVIDRAVRIIQTVGFPIVVAAFLLWEWHSTVRTLQETMTEVRMLLQEIKREIKAR